MEKLIEKWCCMCMGEGDNLIKQADRRRKQEWRDDRLMPTSPGMAHTLPSSSVGDDGVVECEK